MNSCADCRYFSATRICMAPTPAWALVLLSGHGENRENSDPQNEWQGQYCDVFLARSAEGYAVESEHHAGSEQIYPVGALERVEGEPL